MGPVPVAAKPCRAPSSETSICEAFDLIGYDILAAREPAAGADFWSTSGRCLPMDSAGDWDSIRFVKRPNAFSDHCVWHLCESSNRPPAAWSLSIRSRGFFVNEAEIPGFARSRRFHFTNRSPTIGGFLASPAVVTIDLQ